MLMRAVLLGAFLATSSRAHTQRLPHTCRDIGNALDNHGFGCSIYADYPFGCGKYDDNTFNAKLMCCACGGGDYQMPTEGSEAPITEPQTTGGAPAPKGIPSALKSFTFRTSAPQAISTAPSAFGGTSVGTTTAPPTSPQTATDAASVSTSTQASATTTEPPQAGRVSARSNSIGARIEHTVEAVSKDLDARLGMDRLICEDKDSLHSDSKHMRCDAYKNKPSRCGRFDDEDFSAVSMCCSCGGGTKINKKAVVAGTVGGTLGAAVLVGGLLGGLLPHAGSRDPPSRTLASPPVSAVHSDGAPGRLQPAGRVSGMAKNVDALAGAGTFAWQVGLGVVAAGLCLYAYTFAPYRQKQASSLSDSDESGDLVSLSLEETRDCVSENVCAGECRDGPPSCESTHKQNTQAQLPAMSFFPLGMFNSRRASSPQGTREFQMNARPSVNALNPDRFIPQQVVQNPPVPHKSVLSASGSSNRCWTLSTSEVSIKTKPLDSHDQAKTVEIGPIQATSSYGFGPRSCAEPMQMNTHVSTPPLPHVYLACDQQEEEAAGAAVARFQTAPSLSDSPSQLRLVSRFQSCPFYEPGAA